MASIAAEPGTGPSRGEPTPFGGQLEAAFEAHYRPLVRLAALLLDDVPTCEEVVQDAFVRVWRRGPGMRDPEKLPAYLRSAVLNGARSQLRRRGVRRRHLRSVGPPPATPAAETAVLAGDPDGQVLAALRGLPDRQREVLALRYYLDLSESEIAATLGITAGSVKTHAHRGLHALAEALEDRR
ncbi:MAG: RNA polymerase sigma factor [Acidimicrobiia bacterium]